MEVRYICPTAYDSSVYLVNGKVLIDAGMNSDLIIRELEKSIKLTDLELIVLTHCHYDHTAAAAIIAEKSGAKVGIHRADLEGVNDEYLSVSVLFGDRAPAVRPTVVYEEGDKIPIGKEECLEVIHTPGHSKGSICLYEPISKSLFSGDTVFPGGGFGRMDFEGSEPEKMLGSIEKLTKLDVKTLYSGHGAPNDRDGNKQVQASYTMLKMMMGV
ncbi:MULTISPECIES: MBL fold metallo-hydrolase [unclassified Methanosarcina]|uniref:MBL fold metallo-hydrolase n=1 Tax=unclassified Methanosarcina TaxID=2644672 RepID=UPI0006156D17|nr:MULTISPECIES: MBL fold metallo-hydrolase [unclassified Methanosarcina]AKB16894.1 metallo-beta-lactamase [Methanosarcina sp. WWM596]AKB20301.1 metallo-beta-lactamase [Methanosarcina sp. WH1]